MVVQVKSQPLKSSPPVVKSPTPVYGGTGKPSGYVSAQPSSTTVQAKPTTISPEKNISTVASPSAAVQSQQSKISSAGEAAFLLYPESVQRTLPRELLKGVQPSVPQTTTATTTRTTTVPVTTTTSTTTGRTSGGAGILPSVMAQPSGQAQAKPNIYETIVAGKRTTEVSGKGTIAKSLETPVTLPLPKKIMEGEPVFTYGEGGPVSSKLTIGQRIKAYRTKEGLSPAKDFGQVTGIFGFGQTEQQKQITEKRGLGIQISKEEQERQYATLGFQSVALGAITGVALKAGGKGLQVLSKVSPTAAKITETGTTLVGAGTTGVFAYQKGKEIISPEYPEQRTESIITVAGTTAGLGAGTKIGGAIFGEIKPVPGGDIEKATRFISGKVTQFRYGKLEAGPTETTLVPKGTMKETILEKPEGKIRLTQVEHDITSQQELINKNVFGKTKEVITISGKGESITQEARATIPELKARNQFIGGRGTVDTEVKVLSETPKTPPIKKSEIITRTDYARQFETLKGKEAIDIGKSRGFRIEYPGEEALIELKPSEYAKEKGIKLVEVGRKEPVVTLYDQEGNIKSIHYRKGFLGLMKEANIKKALLEEKKSIFFEGLGEKKKLPLDLKQKKYQGEINVYGMDTEFQLGIKKIGEARVGGVKADITYGEMALRTRKELLEPGKISKPIFKEEASKIYTEPIGTSKVFRETVIRTPELFKAELGEAKLPIYGRLSRTEDITGKKIKLTRLKPKAEPPRHPRTFNAFKIQKEAAGKIPEAYKNPFYNFRRTDIFKIRDVRPKELAEPEALGKFMSLVEEGKPVEKARPPTFTTPRQIVEQQIESESARIRQSFGGKKGAATRKTFAKISQRNIVPGVGATIIVKQGLGRIQKLRPSIMTGQRTGQRTNQFIREEQKLRPELGVIQRVTPVTTTTTTTITDQRLRTDQILRTPTPTIIPGPQLYVPPPEIKVPPPTLSFGGGGGAGDSFKITRRFPSGKTKYTPSIIGAEFSKKFKPISKKKAESYLESGLGIRPFVK